MMGKSNVITGGPLAQEADGTSLRDDSKRKSSRKRKTRADEPPGVLKEEVKAKLKVKLSRPKSKKKSKKDPKKGREKKRDKSEKKSSRSRKKDADPLPLANDSEPAPVMENQDQGSNHESCADTLVLSDAESNNCKIEVDKNLIEAKDSSFEGLLGLTGNKNYKLDIVTEDANHNENAESSKEQQKEVDIERNVIEREDSELEVLLGFNINHEAKLVTLNDKTNATIASLKEDKDKKLSPQQNEEMDTCDLSSSKRNDIIVNAEEDFESLKKNLNNKLSQDEDEAMDTCEYFSNLKKTELLRSSKEINSESLKVYKNGDIIEDEVVDQNFEISNKSKSNEENQHQDQIIDMQKNISPKKPLKSKSLKSIVKKKDAKKYNSKGKTKIRSKIKQNSVAATKSGDPHYKVNDEDNISCRICEQTLNDKLKFYTGALNNGFEEELAIIDSRLILFNGDEEHVSREDTRAYNKITLYSVYCKNGHLCPFDSGLIERDIEIYFSGYVKPIYSDDPSMENGVPGKDFGPIAQWWTTGFDTGEQPTVGFSTEIGDYILMQPSEEYQPFMQSVLVKIIISKIVIEYLVYKPHTTYEDLLCKLQKSSSSYDLLPKMTEDVLLHYAPFICNQVMSYDDIAKPNEPLLLVAPCIRRLIDLAGISFETYFSASSRRQVKYQERRTADYRKELLRRIIENKGDNSSTSKMIDSLLPGIEKKLIYLSKLQSRNPCGSCIRCQQRNCEDCEACNKKNYEACPQRRCFFREIQEANDEDAVDAVDLSKLKGKSSINVFRDTIDVYSCFNSKLQWLGKALTVDDTGNTFYEAFTCNEEIIRVGDFVFVHSIDENVPAQVVKIAYAWEDNMGLAHFHANIYWWGRDTVLGELTRTNELFSINKCNSMSLNCITKKVKVDERRVPINWPQIKEKPKSDLFCQKSYEPSTGRFQDLQKLIVRPTYNACVNCEARNRQSKSNEPKTIDELGVKDDRTLYRAVVYNNEEYVVGSCVFLKPKSLYFQYPMLLDQHAKSHGNISKKIDEDRYPEFYRKTDDVIIDSKFDMPSPFDIGYITEIFVTDKLYIKVKKLYRPENTHRSDIINKQCNINELYWSNEVCTIAFGYVIRKCYVSHIKDLNNKSVELWSSLGPDRFYFTQMYQDKKFINIDRKTFGYESHLSENPKLYQNKYTLSTLNIFAGCGGMLLGLFEAGLINNSCWAIENDIIATSTLKLNSPDTLIFEEHPDVVLKKIMKGELVIDGKTLPRQGDVELLCSTLPLENYKDMIDITVFKNSSIATFLSYANYYKPSLFILEADEKFIKRSIVLKLTLACLVSIGYQVTFDLMQVGCYGAPQNQRRAVLLGSAPGQMLPKFPQRLHVFPKSLCQLGIVIDKKKYMQNTSLMESAPYRSITVRDALLDLLPIEYGSNKDVMNYEFKSVSYFSKMMRKNMLEPTVFNHVCKDFGPLVQRRITMIPLSPGSDWRNLPNIEIQLMDGSYAKKLVYNHDDVKAGKRSNGTLKGVCSCASGAKCNPSDRQSNCMIPWYLVHSAGRNRHWVGLYSRLNWDGFFNSAITNPEPLGTQGPILHPTQPRIVSVRECARAQGFPDDFVLPHEIDIHDKYRLIGQSISPFLSRAIGHEIVNTLTEKHYTQAS